NIHENSAQFLDARRPRQPLVSGGRRDQGICEIHSNSSRLVMTSKLSLAAKLYSIFALFALLTAAITALSDYNTRRATELTESIEIADQAALNVERVNSLVYAVVMESRGVYMSTEPAPVKKYGDGLLKFNDQIMAVVTK